jgi:hypothetical protein
MVVSVTRGLQDAEKAALLKGLENLDSFFRTQEHAWDQLLPHTGKTTGEERKD